MAAPVNPALDKVAIAARGKAKYGRQPTQGAINATYARNAAEIKAKAAKMKLPKPPAKVAQPGTASARIGATRINATDPKPPELPAVQPGPVGRATSTKPETPRFGAGGPLGIATAPGAPPIRNQGDQTPGGDLGGGNLPRPPAESRPAPPTPPGAPPSPDGTPTRRDRPRRERIAAQAAADAADQARRAAQRAEANRRSVTRPGTNLPQPPRKRD